MGKLLKDGVQEITTQRWWWISPNQFYVKRCSGKVDYKR
jgi:hypothetical protein